MPRVALTQEQREANMTSGICKSILNAMNSKRGLERKSDAAFAKELGISRTTWWRWNAGGLKDADFGTVVCAAARVGLSIAVVPK